MHRLFAAIRPPEHIRDLLIDAMDDSPDGRKITKHYIEDAIAAALAGKKPEIAETPAVGCAVRYVKERK